MIHSQNHEFTSKANYLYYPFPFWHMEINYELKNKKLNAIFFSFIYEIGINSYFLKLKYQIHFLSCENALNTSSKYLEII